MFDEELNAGSDKIIGQIVAVYLHNRWHDEQVATGVKYVLELMCGINNCSHAVSILKCAINLIFAGLNGSQIQIYGNNHESFLYGPIVSIVIQ